MLDINELFIQIVKVFSLYQIISQNTTITYLNTTEFIEQNFECQLLDDNCELFWEISVSRLEFKNRINQFKLSFLSIKYNIPYIIYVTLYLFGNIWRLQNQLAMKIWQKRKFDLFQLKTCVKAF